MSESNTALGEHQHRDVSIKDITNHPHDSSKASSEQSHTMINRRHQIMENLRDDGTSSPMSPISDGEISTSSVVSVNVYTPHSTPVGSNTTTRDVKLKPKK